MGKFVLGTMLLFGTQLSFLMMIPESLLQSEPTRMSEATKRRSPEMLKVRQIILLPDGILHITCFKEMGMQTCHHFINIRAGNIVLVEDDNMRPELVLLSQTPQGGLEITVSRSWNLNLAQFDQSSGPDSMLQPL